MRGKKWLKWWFCLIAFPILSVGLVNYSVDPLWTFDHRNLFNTTQLHFDERQQKTNHVYFNGLDEYNGVLFGSSRTTFINQNDFVGMHIFNYALDSMYPFEYRDYLNLAKASKGGAFKYIIIGADFYNSMYQREKTFENPQYYIQQSQSFLYRYKMLFSLEVLKKSLRNVKINLVKPSSIYYLRENVKLRDTVSEAERVEAYQQNIVRHTDQFTTFHYRWNDDYFPMLKRLKQENPDTQFLLFTTPISADLFVSMIRNTNRYPEYAKWIKGLVTIFGEIYCFMDINSVTTNLQNYPDDDHFYPAIGKIVAHKIATKNFQSTPKDFGTIVNDSNVNAFLQKQLEKINAYDFSSDYPAEEMAKQLAKGE